MVFLIGFAVMQKFNFKIIYEIRFISIRCYYYITDWR